MRNRLILAIVLLPLSASAQVLTYEGRSLSYAPTMPAAPAWGPPPMPKPSHFPKVRPPVPQKSEHRVQDRIFERLAHCSFDLTPDQRLRDCKNI